jgi:hypothetical protein
MLGVATPSHTAVGFRILQRSMKMPRTDQTVLKGLSGAKNLATHRPLAESRLYVDVLLDEEVFNRFVVSIHDALATHWLATNRGEDFPILVEELLRYSYTAMKTRVARVNDARFVVRCDDAWALPNPIASILAMIGRVECETPVVTIVPRWDPRHDAKVMDYEEWSLFSRRMRALEAVPGSKIILAHAIEGSKWGDEALMALLPVRDGAGRTTRITAMHFEVDPTAAAAYLIGGLWPEAWDGVALPTHPLMLPRSYVEAAAVLMYMHRLADASV